MLYFAVHFLSKILHSHMTWYEGHSFDPVIISFNYPMLKEYVEIKLVKKDTITVKSAKTISYCYRQEYYGYKTACSS